MLNSTIRLLRSVRFNIALGALIALSCAIGTFLPQIPEVPEKVSAYQAASPNLYKLFDFFGLFNLYQSWWFMGLLGLMAVDVVLCKLWNRPPDQGLVALPPEATGEKTSEKRLADKDAALRLKPFRASLESGLSSAAAAKTAADALRREGYHVALEPMGGGAESMVATKHRVQRWGSYTAHVALVVILVGALAKGIWGFVEMVPVLEGGSRAMQNKKWDLFVDKFTVLYYPDKTPKFFSSVVRVEADGQELASKTIAVNDPLDIGGVRFYQASWGAGGMFRSVTLKVGKQEIQMPQRSKTKIAGTPFTVEADLMLPNFRASDGQPDTASLDFKNPAVRFVFHLGPHKTSPLWLFRDEPGLCLLEGADGSLSRAPRPPFELAAIDPILFSGIQVAYDPGFPLVVAGSILWLVGTVSLFYLHRRRVWLLVEPRGDGSAIALGGWSSRGTEEYGPEFARLASRLGHKLGGGQAQISKNPLAEVS